MTLNWLRTWLAPWIGKHLTGPRPLVIRAWFWLAVEADDLDAKRRCLEAVLELNPESQAARAGLALLHQREVSRPEKT